MIIKLQRAYLPTSMEEQDCGICGIHFRPESILAWTMTEGRADVGLACRTCIEYLGQRNPGRFPTIVEYAEAVRRYPQPAWASEEDVERAELADQEAFEEASWATWVWQPPVRG